MKIAVTGATGFLGRHIVRRLVRAGHHCKCWHRTTSDLGALYDVVSDIEWVEGQLGGQDESAVDLVAGCDALVHAALDRPGKAFRGGEGDLATFATRNIVGSLRLFEAARQAKLSSVVFISTCAVHEKIIDDRPLDETHPLWATSHYGAHKAAIEQFVHSFGLGHDLNICSLRPCAIYGIDRPLKKSRWYDFVSDIVRNDSVTCERGGKMVHASDVAKAVELLLSADGTAGESYNCCDGYISQWEVATLAKELSGSTSQLSGQSHIAKHQIETAKLEALGMSFGGQDLVKETVSQLIDRIRAEA